MSARHVYSYDCAVAQVYSLNGVGETIGLPPILHIILGILQKYPSFTRATNGRPYGVVRVTLIKSKIPPQALPSPREPKALSYECLRHVYSYECRRTSLQFKVESDGEKHSYHNISRKRNS